MSTERRRGASLRPQGGLSLLELIMAIVVVGVGVVGMLGALNLTAGHSADPMIERQAQLVAEAYLEEILLKKFVDPEDDRVCPAPEGGGRSAWDNVCDYAGLSDSPPRDQLGTGLAALAGYTVAVTVTPSAASPAGAVALGPLANDYGAGYIRVLRVDVTVTGPAGTSVALTGYRTHYRCNATLAPGRCRPLT
jgi:MSHA pilin protein MshD